MASADLQEAETETPIPAARPFLRRVQIRGYKSIAFCDVKLEPFTVLVGRNGCGKSNFLDALAFLRDAVQHDVREAVQRHGGWAAVACRSEPGTSVEIEVEAEIVQIARDESENPETSDRSGLPQKTVTAKYRIQIANDENAVPKVVVENYSKVSPDGTIDQIFDRDVLGLRYSISAEHTQLAPTITSGSLNGVDFMRVRERPEKCAISYFADPLFSNFTVPVETIVVLNPAPSLMRMQQLPTGGMYLQHHAANLPSILRRFARSSPEWYERAKRYVKYIVPEVSDLAPIKYGDYETLRFWMNYAVNDKKVEFDARSMSDGTLRAIACIIGVFQNIPPYGRPSLVGIEEPETSLHPAAMNGLVDALDEATLATQVIITTHSAELLDNPTIKPQNVRVVHMLNGKTYIGPVDGTTIGIVRKNLNTLGGLERDSLLDADFDDLTRQQALEVAGSGSR